MLNAFIVFRIGDFIIEKLFGKILPNFERIPQDKIHPGEFTYLITKSDQGTEKTFHFFTEGTIHQIKNGNAEVTYTAHMVRTKFEHDDDYYDAIERVSDSDAHKFHDRNDEELILRYFVLDADYGMFFFPLTIIERIEYA